MKRSVFFVVLCIFLNLFLIQAGVSTELGISNSAPVLVKDIPNQTWDFGNDLLSAFDLDDYFEDFEEGVQSYSFSDVENISILINSTNEVSFFPDSGFSGLRQVIFYASDGNENTSSNTVFLRVGLDDQAPNWSSMTLDKSTIMQNDFVNFSTLWSDNFALNDYVLAINQGSGWTNYSGSFSGVFNISTYLLQISASSGTVVSWMFCANDTSFNINCTDIQNFTVVSSPTSVSVVEEDDDSDLSKYYQVVKSLLKKTQSQNFSTNVDSFSVLLKQGNSETRVLEISNIGTTNLSFDLSVEGLEGIEVLFSEDSFTLDSGDMRRITIDFVVSKDFSPGQYFATLIIDSSEKVRIPIIIHVLPLVTKFSLSVDVLEDYKSLKKGGPVLANVTLISLEDKIPTNLTLYLALKDFEGNIYDSFQEEILLTSMSNFEKTLALPEDVAVGKYLFYGRISDENILSMDSDFFEVGSRFVFAAFIKSSFVFLLIAVLSTFSFFLILKYKRARAKERALKLYVNFTELKKLIKEEKFDEAADLFISIKRSYGESVSKDILEDKEKLKEAIKKLSEQLIVEENNEVETKNVVDKTISSETESSEKPIPEKDVELGDLDKEVSGGAQEVPLSGEKNLAIKENTEKTVGKISTPASEIKKKENPNVSEESPKKPKKNVLKNKSSVKAFKEGKNEAK